MCEGRGPDYPSHQVAVNAATLHLWKYSHCFGVDVYAHGDHWHYGHPTRRWKRICKRGYR